MPDKKKRKTPEERLADLEKREKQLKARMQKERAKIKEAKRKKDTRRKIVAGAIVLKHMEHSEAFKAEILALLGEHVKGKDRELFDL